MVIERSASNTLVVMARETLSPSYWLLHFNDPDRNGNAYCIVQAGNATGAMITLTFSEVASGAVATSGQVTLSPPGNWQVTIYEQTSSSNLNTANANRLVYTQAIFVEGGAGAETGWTDECPSTGDECDPLTVEVNGTTYGTLADPCGATFDVDVVQDGTPVGSLVDGEWVIPSCGDLSIGINGGDGTITVPDPCGASVSISVTQGGVEVGSYAGNNEWEIPVCDPVILTINNQSFGQIDDPCGVTLGIEVVDEDDVAVGSLTGGGKWEIPDADVTFDGLPVGDVAPGQTLNLDCGTLLDGAYVQDGGSVTGNYFVTGMLNGREVYTKDVDHNLEYTGTRWRLVKPGSDVDAALGSEEFPWNADWSATSVTVEQSTIGSYCGGDQVQCADLTIAINGTTYGTVTDPCGATAPVDVHDSNGNDVGSLVSGAWVIGNSTITKPDGTTIGLAATASLDVRDYRSGIAYKFGTHLWNGQQTSYRTGDEGYYWTNGLYTYTEPVYPLTFARLSDFTTMAANNVHGNTLRFTDRNGLAAASSGNRVVQDHLTGLEWYIPASLPAATTWNNAIDAAESSTVESSSDWFLPNDRVLDTITDDSLSQPLNYAPFLIANDLWTSATVPNDTTFARRLLLSTAPTGGLLGRGTKANNDARYIFCRKFL